MTFHAGCCFQGHFESLKKPYHSLAVICCEASYMLVSGSLQPLATSLILPQLMLSITGRFDQGGGTPIDFVL